MLFILFNFIHLIQMESFYFNMMLRFTLRFVAWNQFLIKNFNWFLACCTV